MTQSLSSKINATLTWVNTQTGGLTSGTADSFVESSSSQFLQALADGSGANQAHQMFASTYTTTAGSNNDLTLSGLTQTVFGSTVTINFASVKLIWIANLNSVTGDKLNLDSSVTHSITGPYNGSITSKIEIGPNSVCVLSNLYDGWAVSSGSTDVLRIHAVNHSITYNVIIIGT